MTRGVSLEATVNLGYGDVINAATAWDAKGQPIWLTIQDQPKEVGFPTLFVCANESSRVLPQLQLSAGHIEWRTQADGQWLPGLSISEFGTTLRAVAVRVLGTMATDEVRKLLEQDAFMPYGEKLTMDPEMEAFGRETIDIFTNTPRIPTVYEIPADLGMLDNPSPYLAQKN
jgi:hypothetical protein